MARVKPKNDSKKVERDWNKCTPNELSQFLDSYSNKLANLQQQITRKVDKLESLKKDSELHLKNESLDRMQKQLKELEEEKKCLEENKKTADIFVHERELHKQQKAAEKNKKIQPRGKKPNPKLKARSAK
jgi:hypothetical protein